MVKPTNPDLSWIEPYVQRIRSYVSVRLKDNVLIRMPNECFKLNASGACLLHYLLNGGKLKKVLKERSHDPEAHRQINEFFSAISLMLGSNLCERFESDAVDRVGFELGYIELPILAELAITDRCNIRCRFCYASCLCSDDSDQTIPVLPNDELTTRQFKKIIKIIRYDAGVPSMSFTGGEPMLRKDIYDLIRYAATDMGMRVNLITNGTLITEKKAHKLKVAGLASAQVSIESPDPLIHDQLTQVKGSQARSIKGLKALVSAGIMVHFHATICSENSDSLIKMPEFAKDLCIDRFSLNMIIPVGRGKDDILAVRYRDMSTILQPIISAARKNDVKFMWYAPTPLCLFNPIAHRLGNKGCAACEGLLAIDPQGNVLPCSSWKEPVGSLLTDNFKSIWFGERARWLRGKEAAPAECDGCSDFSVCHGSCPLYFKAFPEDRIDLICQQLIDETEESHGVNIHASGVSTS
ncbi:radical SAM protein [bacterium]|nr:radical SAM protein [bacterium]